MKSDICVQLRERGEDVAATFIDRLGKQLAEADKVNITLERAYSQRQKAWSDAIARADRYEAALKKIACDQSKSPCTCADEDSCSYGIAKRALEKKDD